MAEKIAVIDFPPGENSTSHFVVNGAEGPGGLVTRIKESGFESDLIDYRTLAQNPINPVDYKAVFFASGWTNIKNPNTQKLNPDLETTCGLYNLSIDQNVPVIAFTHGGQILAFHTNGDYFPLPKDDERTRMEAFGAYTPADENALNQWLLEGISEQDLKVENFAREFRKYGINLTDNPDSSFKALVNPDLVTAGPAIAIHKDPTKIAVLFMMHPEYNKDLPGYKLMENVFAKLKQ